MKKSSVEEKIAQQVISDQSFNQLLTDRITDVQNIISKGATGFVTEIMVISLDNMQQHKTVFLVPSMPAPEEKAHAMRQLGRKIFEAGLTPISLFLTSEAWIKKMKKDEEFPKDKHVSDFDDKQEAIVISGLTLDGRLNMSVIGMKRSKKKGVTLEKPQTTLYKNGSKKEISAFILENIYIGYAQARFEKEEPSTPPSDEPLYKVDLTPDKND